MSGNNPEYRCSMEGCVRNAVGRSLCLQHYDQARHNGTLDNYKRVNRDAMVRDALGNKLCPSCESWLPESFFQKNGKQSSDSLQTYCRECRTPLNAGISFDTFHKKLMEQKFRCAICRKKISDYSGEKRKCHIDHDHRCKRHSVEKTCDYCFRGLLCGSCNTGIGMLQDNQLFLKNAIEYLGVKHAVEFE